MIKSTSSDDKEQKALLSKTLKTRGDKDLGEMPLSYFGFIHELQGKAVTITGSS